jgi:hypothetical protein
VSLFTPAVLILIAAAFPLRAAERVAATATTSR